MRIDEAGGFPSRFFYDARMAKSSWRRRSGVADDFHFGDLSVSQSEAECEEEAALDATTSRSSRRWC
jgi:hypothetical protein